VAHLPRPDRAAGVFETILVIEGAPVELDAHLRRLRASVNELFGVEPPPVAREALLAEAAPLSLGRMRLTVHPGPDGVLGLEAVAGQVDPDDVFPAWDRAAELAPFVMGGGLGPHKWADRAALERVSASAGGRLPLVLDAGAEVLEAATGVNLWREWAKLEIADGKAPARIKAPRREYAGIILSLAKQEDPDTSAYVDEEIVYRVKKRHHAGLTIDHLHKRAQLLNRGGRQFHIVPSAQIENCRQPDIAIDMSMKVN